ncbi:uracil-DNA glycosylase [Heyndrickxia coagulans]|uniref:uracil-DNA glycosylase n=1 Tax=Heyndrickxia coagulans TaxID=1398 RepID=UPI00105EFF73|nr:uracil-DNA glycosylase [Heyndrickxia coagulans]MBF8417601.1 uracil-DNA glycosylase [Heyndrickxia coagulans]UZH05423.1 uracil-DNA glycosylase [Heyndrickxia coagulans]
MKDIFKNDWGPLLKEEFQKPYYLKLREFLKKEYATQRIHPDMYDIFNAFHYTAYRDVKVVLLGQDPYHGPGQAHGLSFSVKPGVDIPPSLRNIFKELHDDVGCRIPQHGCLVSWAKQGVMLLNTVLTVREGQAHSHQGMGWEIFIDEVIRKINAKETPVIFLLWGRPAQSKKALIDTNKHFVLTAAHPSPLSAHRGFFGSRPFSKTNNILRKLGEKEIDWQLPEQEKL